MWIKNAIIFTLSESMNPELLNEKLLNEKFSPIGKTEFETSGFVKPVPFTDALVKSTKNSSIHKIMLRYDTKVLPKSAIDAELNERIEKIKAEEQRDVGRKEKRTIKEVVTDDLLAKALVKTDYLTGYFSEKYFIVDTSSKTKAEALLSLVRYAMGGLEAKIVKTKYSIGQLLNSWVTQEIESAEPVKFGHFQVGKSCTFQDTSNESEVIKVTNSELNKQYDALVHTKDCIELKLIWQESVSFKINTDFQIKGIKFSEMIKESASNEGDDFEALSNAVQIITIGRLTDMLDDLIGNHLSGLDNGDE